MKVTRCGKNKLGIRGTWDANGNLVNANNGIRTELLDVTPGQICTVYKDTPITGGTYNMMVRKFDTSGTFVGSSQLLGYNSVGFVQWTVPTDVYKIGVVQFIDPSMDMSTIKLMFATEVATSYEPYYSTTLPISLKYATGSTVYGGTVTINRDGTGSVVVDRAYIEMSEFQYESSATRFWYANVPTPYGATVSRTGSFVCDKYIAVTDGRAISGVTTGMCYFGAQKSNGNCDFYVHDTRYTDATTFNAAVTPVAIAYKLSTPTTYTLTAPQLTSLLGNNTVWCDAGQVTVKYKMDIGKALDAMKASLIEAGLYVDMGGVIVEPGA